MVKHSFIAKKKKKLLVGNQPELISSDFTWIPSTLQFSQASVLLPDDGQKMAVATSDLAAEKDINLGLGWIISWTHLLSSKKRLLSKGTEPRRGCLWSSLVEGRERTVLVGTATQLSSQVQKTIHYAFLSLLWGWSWNETTLLCEDFKGPEGPIQD